MEQTKKEEEHLAKGDNNWISHIEDEEVVPGGGNVSSSIGSGPIFHARRKPQFIAATIISFGGFLTGIVLGWSSPAIPALAESKDLGDLTSDDKSWIASLAVLGALISGIFTGFVINKLGRRRTMIFLAFPFLLGWILIAFAHNLPMMNAGRFITGFCAGAHTVVVPVFISEIAEDKLRGLLGSAMVLQLVTGILFTFGVAIFVSWFWLSILCAICPVILYISLQFIPEAPRYLLLNGRTKDAYESLKWLRGATTMEQIEPELTKLRDSLENNNIGKTSIRQLLYKSALKPTGISLALFFFQQLGGINAVCFYTIDILREANPNFDANVASVIIGVVQVTFVLLSMLMVDRLGRKIFLFSTFVIMGLSLTALGVFFKLKAVETESNTQETTMTMTTTTMAFVPLVSLILFIMAYSAGAGPLPWLIMSEIIPPNVKGLAAGIVTTFYWFLAFVSTKTFDNLSQLLHNYGCYWLYAGLCFCGAVFTIIFLPETKNKTTLEIAEYFGAQPIEPTKPSVSLLSQESLSYHDQKVPFTSSSQHHRPAHV